MIDRIAALLRGLDRTALLMGVTFALIWSSAFTSAKVALLDAPPFSLLCARFFLAGLIAVAIAAALGQRLPGQRAVWLAIGIIGICQNSLYLGLNFLAMTTVPAGLAAIIASSLPLVVALGGGLIARRMPSPVVMVGLLAGLAGVFVIMAGRLQGGADAFGIACCLIGVLALAAATLLVRGSQFGTDLLMVVGLQMLVGSVTLLPVALALESDATVNPTLRLAVAFGYTTLVPGIVATLIWFRLVRRIGAVNAAAFHFLNPAFGVLVASLVLGETLTAVDLVGVAIVTVSILLVQLAGTRRST